MTIVPRWEWRTFGRDFGSADTTLSNQEPVDVIESEELYLLSRHSDASAKVRDGLMDVKALQARADDGLEQWLPVMKAEFPLDSAELGRVLEILKAPPSLDHDTYSVDDLGKASPDLVAVQVRKSRVRYKVGG